MSALTSLPIHQSAAAMNSDLLSKCNSIRMHQFPLLGCWMKVSIKLGIMNALASKPKPCKKAIGLI